MPQVRAERFIRLDPESAFELSQTTGQFRLKWDPFISAQGIVDGATRAGKGVRTRTVWRFTPDDGGTRAVWKYTFSCRPALLKRPAELIGAWLLGREIERRIEAFARACEDQALLAGLRSQS